MNVWEQQQPLQMRGRGYKYTTRQSSCYSQKSAELPQNVRNFRTLQKTSCYRLRTSGWSEIYGTSGLVRNFCKTSETSGHTAELPSKTLELPQPEKTAQHTNLKIA